MVWGFGGKKKDKEKDADKSAKKDPKDEAAGSDSPADGATSPSGAEGASPLSPAKSDKSSIKGVLKKEGESRPGTGRRGTNESSAAQRRGTNESSARLSEPHSAPSVPDSAGADPNSVTEGDESPQHLVESAAEVDEVEVGHKWDREVDDMSRAVVVCRRHKLLDDTLHPSRTLKHVGKSESLITANPASLARFFSGDGAVYQQYDIGRSTFEGGGLMEGWTAVKSRSSGRTYYANASTGEAQWNAPLYPLSDGWVARRTNAGAVYYLHMKSGEWRWDRPVDEDFAVTRATYGEDEAFKTRRLNRPDCTGEVLALPPIQGAPLSLPPSPAKSMRRSHSRLQSYAATGVSLQSPGATLTETNLQLALTPSPGGRR